MAYSIGRKARTRQSILEAANRLFAAKGYEGTSIDEIMRACGLTRGGFYAHFASKEELYRNALAPGRSIDAMLGEYLDTAAPAGPRPSPAFAFLAIDVASKSPEVRAAYTEAFTSISAKLLSHTSASRCSAESCSLSAAALIVGALAVAHTTDNPDLRSRLLAACRENAGMLLGGRDRATTSFFWEPVPGSR
jgi:TetR/AcrR family transcriptional regulator, transcriptional repressor for nem operon